MRIGNRWMTHNFEIQTPIGRGTIVGMTPDHTRILVMHTHREKKGTFSKWWSWSEEKGEIIGEYSTKAVSDAEGNNPED